MTRRPSLGAIFLTVFLDLLGFSLVLPFLADEARTTFHTSAFTGTLLSAIYSLMQFLFVPVWGRVSDRIGRRPVMLASIASTAVGMLGLALGLLRAEHVGWLFAARALSGIATANLGTASAYIADVTPPEERAKGMGLIGMAFGLGFILGPGIGGALSGIPIQGRLGVVPCLLAAGLSVLNFVWAYFGLGESLPPDKRGEPVDASLGRRLSPFDLTAARAAFAREGIALGVFVNFAIILSFTNLDQTFRYFNKDLFGMTAMQTGGLLAFTGVVAAGVQGGLVRRLAKKHPEQRLIRAGVGIQAIAFATMVAAPSIGRGVLYVACALLALGNGLSQPSVSAYISKRADPKAQGATLGTNQSMSSLARVFGPAMGGWLYGNLGARAPYMAAAIGMCLAFVVALRLVSANAPEPPAKPS
jgi:MFS transporter, DHA1 family, tetracycline resistance protein